MTLSDRLQTDMTNAMRERDEVRLEALRMAVAAAYNAKKAAGRTLTDDEVLAVLARESKARRESMEAFAAAGRDDAAGREKVKLEVLTEYMPRALTEPELDEVVRQAISETAASSPRDMGRVMGVVMPRVKSRAEGKQVQAAVARMLAQHELAEHGH